MVKALDRQNSNEILNFGRICLSHGFTSILLLGWIANIHFLKGTGVFHPHHTQTTYGQIALFEKGNMSYTVN